jgi:hypothetical protein
MRDPQEFRMAGVELQNHLNLMHPHNIYPHAATNPFGGESKKLTLQPGVLVPGFAEQRLI